MDTMNIDDYWRVRSTLIWIRSLRNDYDSFIKIMKYKITDANIVILYILLQVVKNEYVISLYKYYSWVHEVVL